MNAAAAAGLFVENGLTHIPLGTATVYGRVNIQKDCEPFSLISRLPYPALQLFAMQGKPSSTVYHILRRISPHQWW